MISHTLRGSGATRGGHYLALCNLEKSYQIQSHFYLVQTHLVQTLISGYICILEGNRCSYDAEDPGWASQSETEGYAFLESGINIWVCLLVTVL